MTPPPHEITPDHTATQIDDTDRRGLQSDPATRIGQHNELRFPFVRNEEDANFSIKSNGDDSSAGFSMLLDLDQDAGHVHTAVYIDPAAARRGIGADATLLTVNYAFAMWNIRKVYFETTEASSGDFGAMLDKSPEATLKDYIFFRGNLWDLKVCALTRDEWEKEPCEYVKKLTPQG
ncbi:GNAT family N-acetyltransferase [Nocardiopsis sp. NPDC058631]|uniref:GNAT family N-acetyltransferase n=1 Tax=Nocardiopsis sp. NPDC058631 TaxID=3346566 RepID=UPI00365A8CCC